MAGLLVLDLVVLGKFLWTGGIPLHGDLAFPMSIERYREDFYPLWNPYGSLSNMEDIDRLLVVLPLLHGAEAIGMTIGTFVKALTFATLFSSQIAMFYWARMLLTDNLLTARSFTRHDVDFAAAGAAVLFGFSPWVMVRMSAWFFWLAYAVTPLLLLVLTAALRDRKPLYLIAVALLWSVGSGSPQFTLFLGVLLLAWALFLAVRGVASWRYTAASLGGLVAIYAVINAYWIWPIIKSWSVQAVSPGYFVSTADVDLLSRNATPLNVLLGRDEWLRWWDPLLATGDGFGDVIWTDAALLLLALCCFAIVVGRNKAGAFLAAVLAVSFLLTQGSKGPFGGIYMWLAVDAPGAESWGWLIRAPEKFGSFFWFALASLLALSTAWLLTALRGRGRPPWLGIASVVTLVLFVTLPKLLSGTWGPYVPVQVPQAYQTVNDWLDRRPGDSKTLWLARYETGAVSVGHAEHTWASGRWAGYVFPRSSSRPSYGGYQYTNPFAQYRAFLLEQLDSPALPKLLAAQGIGYVVYHADIRGSRAAARRDLANLRRNLRPVLRRGPVQVFRNERPAPLVAAPSAVLIVHGGMRSLRLLAERTELDPRRATVILRDQHRQLPDMNAFRPVRVLYDVSPRDVAVDRLLSSRGSVVWPFAFVKNGDPDAGWARARISSQFDGDWPWHKYVRDWLDELDRWELDRGRGIVTSRARNAGMVVPLEVPRDGTYNVYVRVFRHPHGGRIFLSAPGARLAELDTSGADQSFAWELVGTVRLRRGGNPLKIVSPRGHNMLAAIGAVPVDAGRARRLVGASAFLGETTSQRHSNLARVVLPTRRSSFQLFTEQPVRRSVELRLIPGGGSHPQRSSTSTLRPAGNRWPAGEYFALLGRGIAPLVQLDAIALTPRDGATRVRRVGGSLEAVVRGARRWQEWRTKRLGIGSFETRLLAAEIAATSVRDFHVIAVWRRGSRIQRVEYPFVRQTGSFNRLIVDELRPPRGARTMELRIRARSLNAKGGSWQIRRLEVSGLRELVPYTTVLVGGEALRKKLRGSRENADAGPATTTSGRPIAVALRRPSIARLAESFDPYWSGEASSGLVAKRLVAFGSVNAFAVPSATKRFEIEYLPQRWTVQGATLSIGVLALFAVGLFVRFRRRLNRPREVRRADLPTPRPEEDGHAST